MMPHKPCHVTLCVCLSVEKNLWTSVNTQGPTPLPRSLHPAVLIKNKVYSFGGWVPVVGEDGTIPDNETEWRCTNSLVCLNLGECNWLNLSDHIYKT